jgi:integrase
MPKAQLLTSTVKRLPCPGGKDQQLWWDHGHKDAVRGLGLRVTAKGIRSYLIRGYPNGQERRLTLEATIHEPIEKARAEADEKRVTMNRDIDIREQERAQRAAKVAEMHKSAAETVTLREVMTEYLECQTGRTGQPLRQATKLDIERHVTVNLADWADEPLKALTKDRIAEKYIGMKARAPSQANQCMTVLRGLINRARERFVGDDDQYPLHPINPVTRLFSKNGLLKWHREKPRTTRIPRAKIGAVWAMLQRRRAAARTVDERASADWVCLVMLTGCRRKESGSLLWENVNLEVGSLHLPSTSVKNHNGITLPMSTTLQEILVARRKLPAVHEKAMRRRKSGRSIRERSAYVFPSWGKAGYITDARATMQAVSEVAGLHLGLHDLRRTADDVATICGIDADVRRQLLNHIDTDVHGRHYANNLDHDALADAVEAIASWIVKQGEIAEAMLSGDNVIALRG